MQTAPLNDLIGHLDALLNPSAFDDYGPNGLQVPGTRRDCARSSPASARGSSCSSAPPSTSAELVLVHHGLFWGARPAPIDAQLKRRLKLLFEHDIALAAYHLPLDAHPEVGNNALLAEALGATDRRAVRRASACAPGFAGDGIPPTSSSRACARRPRPRAARLPRRAGRVRTIGDRLRRRRQSTSTTRSPRASTPSSPASRAST